MSVLNNAIQLAYKLNLSNYETLVNNVIIEHSTEMYEEKMHAYIKSNHQLDQDLQSDFSMNKKLFNALQKSNLTHIGLITEAWCMDACNILPLFRAIEIANNNVEVAIYLRDKSDDLMNLFLTNNSKSIPIVFGLDKDKNEIFRWGPRSQNAMKVFLPLKDEPYSIKSKALKDFYLEDKTQSIQEEWIDKIK